MENNKIHINFENAAEWLAASGFIFPRNMSELTRFNALHGNIELSNSKIEFDPNKYFAEIALPSENELTKEEIDTSIQFDVTKVRIPEHIYNIMKPVENNYFEKNKYVKKWKHKSVISLIKESGEEDAYEEIRNRARKKVLYAIDRGWEGPPYSAIQLAQILGIELAPNDSIADARTIPLGVEKFRIEYNPFQKPTRMNFSISHEITHTLFNDCYEMIRNREEDPEENKELEELCNVGAAELQLPYVLFPREANNLDDITLVKLVDLAKRYKTSLEALFLSFVQVIDRPCAILICTFMSEQELVISYYKGSSTFKPTIPKNFKIPKNSVAYLCNTPGWSKQETVKWDFLDGKWDIHCIGLSPVRKDKRGRVGIIVVPNDGKEELQNRRISIDYGDVSKPQGDGVKIIAQVVNTGGSLARGVGKSLQKNFPDVKKAMDKWKTSGVNFRLGKSQLIQVEYDTYVFQMLAQKGLFVKDGKIPLDYEALELCLIELRETALDLKAEVHMPLIGAGNAKGKWEIIEGLIYSHLVNHDVKVHIYLWGNKKPEDFNPSSSLSLFNEKSTWRREK
jgi:hypothetical protein